MCKNTTQQKQHKNNKKGMLDNPSDSSTWMLYNKLYPFQHNAAWQWMESESHSFITTKLFISSVLCATMRTSTTKGEKWKKNSGTEVQMSERKKILITHSHIYKDTRKIERMRGIFRHRQTIEEICGEGKNPLSQSVVYNTDSSLDVKNKYSDKCKVLTLSVDSSNHSCV